MTSRKPFWYRIAVPELSGLDLLKRQITVLMITVQSLLVVRKRCIGSLHVPVYDTGVP